MKRFVLSLLFILSVGNCMSFEQRIERHDQKIDEAKQIVENSDLSEDDKEIVIDALDEAKQRNHEIKEEHKLAELYRKYRFRIWAFVVVVIIISLGIIYFKFKTTFIGWAKWLITRFR